jgi:hypothetical protein
LTGAPKSLRIDGARLATIGPPTRCGDGRMAA